MERRNFLKIGAVALVATTTQTLATETTQAPYSKYREKIYNRERYTKSANPTKGELKHTPEIKIGKTDSKGYTLVEITVGQEGIIHPSSKDHWIDFIELEGDGELLARTFFEPGTSMGYVAYKVKLNGIKKLTAREGCNKHGIWQESIKL
jgi:superoxide reductase